MDTSNENSSRAGRTLKRIQSMLRVHERLGAYAARLQIKVENTAVILSGTLPNQELRSELVPTIRRAGVLWQVKNRVDVAAS
ncbi:BON domain-containing protein [Aporhodopirellula aestuarii]|uniref:BON domain-containing protein n=1 Tax=Aporhodopirellula aestuarii TaxID=2950107 RepID=A0ABT0U1W6_9BACT|nr:BON domain-containing protein [Aporhodopirellula aestuarii]MCM2370894.1 BON domain-containing protein [Aporhodopirellula aestuarii]